MNAPSRKPVARMLWPVCDDPFTMRPVQWFDDYYAAVDFVTANLGKRNFYIGEPRHALTETQSDPLRRVMP